MKTKSNTNKLVRRLKGNDIIAFNELFDEFSSRLYHFAFGYFKSKEDAEELVQDVFTKIWENRTQLKEGYEFQSYLFTIAFNQIKKHFRSKNIMDRYLEYFRLNLNEEAVVQPDEEYRTLTDRVNYLVEQMPDKRRTVFVKSRIEGKNVLKISEEMNISKKTVENHLHAALKYLRLNLTKEHFMGLLFFCLFIF